ncbi:glycosyltransferase 87 family protein [Gordonia sp. ABSL1-1]|uniref:glycosyltransferase family 87 protein n=1 Tax=Gordonia sp. ABSL1-1 TaxID=3053923 RepID=UPI00257334F6|nr:glycosyltransferase 87 family protein [Gordonia sp. ABSL1-1]MDL9935316.1 glycosyltransferase 87 family protein [Gordonia sp. ABSL1-1]
MTESGADGDVGEDARDSPATLATDRRTDEERVRPSHTDALVAEATGPIGGRSGRHAAVGRSRHLTPIRVLFGLGLVMLALSWFGKAGCLQQAAPDDGSAGKPGAVARLDWDDQRAFTDLCYSDVISLYGAEHLNKGAMPYRDSWRETGPDGEQITRYMEYPVITGMYMYGAAWLTTRWEWLHEHWGVPGAIDVVMFFNIVALGLALSWLLTIWATALTARTRIWSAWLIALSPLVLVHAFTNFDALATAFVALALLSWARRKPWLAGIFIGLGAATKLYPALLLIALVVLCLRAGKLREFAVTAGTAVLAWLAVNLPVMIAYTDGWREFFRLNADRGADPDTLYRVVADLGGFTWNIGHLNALSALAMVLIVAMVAVVGLVAPTRPRLAQLAFLLVAGFLLVNKVWSPQYSLWLVPLAVLAVPHARLLLAWMVVDALVWIPRMGLFLDPSRRWLPEEWFTAAVLIRAAMVLVLCVVVIWQIWHPREDLVRRRWGGGLLDDPAGGVLDGTPDRLAMRPPVSSTRIVGEGSYR